jgi:hypothetical protein
MWARSYDTQPNAGSLTATHPNASRLPNPLPARTDPTHSFPHPTNQASEHAVWRSSRFRRQKRCFSGGPSWALGVGGVTGLLRTVLIRSSHAAGVQTRLLASSLLDHMLIARLTAIPTVGGASRVRGTADDAGTCLVPRLLIRKLLLAVLREGTSRLDFRPAIGVADCDGRWRSSPTLEASHPHTARREPCFGHIENSRAATGVRKPSHAVSGCHSRCRRLHGAAPARPPAPARVR